MGKGIRIEPLVSGSFVSELERIISGSKNPEVVEEAGRTLLLAKEMQRHEILHPTGFCNRIGFAWYKWIDGVWGVERVIHQYKLTIIQKQPWRDSDWANSMAKRQFVEDFKEVFKDNLVKIAKTAHNEYGEFAEGILSENGDIGEKDLVIISKAIECLRRKA